MLGLLFGGISVLVLRITEVLQLGMYLGVLQA